MLYTYLHQSPRRDTRQKQNKNHFEYITMYSKSAIDPYSLEHKQCYNNIVIGKEKYIYILQQVRRDILLRA